MHLVNCEHPIKVFNKYINEWMYVPCRKCNTCRNSRAKRWVDRLEQERSCHPFTMFIYLDYDNEHLPKYGLSHDPFTGETFLSDSAYTFDDDLYNATCIPFDELKFDDSFDHDYFSERINHPLGIPHGSVRDLQLFFKRFNKYCFDNVTKTYRNFRYFVCQEYGPTTHRPHYHGLFFVDNQAVADRFCEILSHSWQLGHSDYQLVESSASSYVAQYLNCDTHLPSFFKHPKLRPFFLCSRKPPIGSLLQSESEVLEIFHSASPQRVVRSGKAEDCLSLAPLLPSLKDRLFPKLPRYGALSHSLRTQLYGLVDVAQGRYYQDYDGWFAYLKERCFPSEPVNGDWFDFSSFVGSPAKYLHSEINRYLCVISDNFNEDRPLRELFRVSNRVLFQCAIFGVSLDEYVSKIEEFYNNVEFLKLKSMYNAQIEILNDGRSCTDDLVFMYPLYAENVSESLSLNLRISDTPDYKKMCAFHAEIAEHNTKTSKKNAYFENNLSKTDFKLYNTIKKFYNGKKRYEDAETLA